MEIFFIALVLGCLPGFIAQSKGRNFVLWWLYGAAIFVVALPHSLIIKRHAASEPEQGQPHNVAASPPRPSKPPAIVERVAPVPQDAFDSLVFGDRLNLVAGRDSGAAGRVLLQTRAGLAVGALSGSTARRVQDWARGGERIIATVATKTAGQIGERRIDVRLRCDMMGDALEMPAAADPSASPKESGDLAGQLEKLAALKASGMLSAEEFDAAKRKVLGG